MTRLAASVRASGSSNANLTIRGGRLRGLWILLFWAVGTSWTPPTAECFVAHVMRSFLWQQQRRRSPWSATTSTATRFFFFDTSTTTTTKNTWTTAAGSPSCFSGVAAASNPSSAQSYFDRHSRLFSSSSSSSSVVSSASNNNMGNTHGDGDENNTTPTTGDGEQKFSDYEKWVRRLYMTNLFHPVKMGLTNMQKLHDIMGDPMDDPNRMVIHIAGTNGKGSVALKTATALQKCGLKVGLFCSPHISSFRERMQVNGEMITEEEVVELLPQIYDWCAQEDIPATFFEITTALAFYFYAKRETQVVVLETGLGGRLDATNVIKRPAISVITSIGLEHTRILGDTVELIAGEKGGIIKEGCPVLVGPHCPQEVLQQCAREKEAGRYYNPEQVLKDYRDMEITDYDEENSRISKAALILLKHSNPDLLKDLTESMIDEAVTIRPSCRFEQVQREDGSTIILDVAHNPPAMDYLVRKLKATYPESSFRFVTGMSSDKDLGQCGRTLLSVADSSQIHLVEAAHPRAAKLPDILVAEPRLAECQYNLEDRSITTQVNDAIELSRQKGEILVICGSVFLMAEAREALGFDEPRDSEYIAQMAGAGFRHGQENFGNTTMPEDAKST